MMNSHRTLMKNAAAQSLTRHHINVDGKFDSIKGQCSLNN
jgi:hypothetical protein